MRQHVLVIDDNQFWLQYLTRQLERAGYRVSGYRDAQAAMAEVEPTTAALVVDVLLGYNTIFPLLHAMQSDREVAHIPIIVCTSATASLPPQALASYGVRQTLDKTTMHPGDISLAVKRVVA